MVNDLFERFQKNIGQRPFYVDREDRVSITTVSICRLKNNLKEHDNKES